MYLEMTSIHLQITANTGNVSSSKEYPLFPPCNTCELFHADISQTFL